MHTRRAATQLSAHCHRDIKPENLLLLDHSENSPLKIADFGVRTPVWFLFLRWFQLDSGGLPTTPISDRDSDVRRRSFCWKTWRNCQLLPAWMQVATWKHKLVEEKFPQCGTPGDTHIANNTQTLDWRVCWSWPSLRLHEEASLLTCIAIADMHRHCWRASPLQSTWLRKCSQKVNMAWKWTSGRWVCTNLYVRPLTEVVVVLFCWWCMSLGDCFDFACIKMAITLNMR